MTVILPTFAKKLLPVIINYKGVLTCEKLIRNKHSGFKFKEKHSSGKASCTMQLITDITSIIGFYLGFKGRMRLYRLMLERKLFYIYWERISEKTILSKTIALRMS